MTNAILIIIALILFFLVCLKRLDISLGLIALTLFSYLIRFKIFNIPFTFLEMMILVMFAVWLAKTLVKREKIYLSSFLRPGLFLILVAMVSVIVSPDTRAALGIFKAYFIEPFLFFLVFINVIRTKKELKYLIFCLAVGALFLSIIAIWQYLGLIPGLKPYITESPKRATSLFEFPTAVGKYLGPIIALFFALIFANNKVLKEENYFPDKFYLWGVPAVLLLATVFSFTRGALMGLAGAFVFLSFFSRYKKIIWLGILLIMIVFISLPWGRHELLSVFSGQDTSTDVHAIMWQGTWRMLKAHPVFGAGLAGFPALYNVFRDPAHVELFPYPDNWFLAVWSELGLAGLAAFGWLIAKYIKEAISLLRKNIDPYFRQLILGLLAVIIVLFIHGLVDTPYFKNDLSVMFWLFVGILAVVKKTGEACQKGENSV
ncbi:MAG: O-antigen ligase family protein [Patescibacteria group bacterium]